MMKKYVIVALVVALLGLLIAPASARPQDSGTSVSVNLSSGVTKLGADVQIVVVIDGGVGGSIGDLPMVDGLALGRVPQPSRETSMRVSGGRRVIQQRLTWRIPVQPTRTGDFVIPSFNIVAGSDTYQTRVMNLRVREDLAGAELGYMTIDVNPNKLVVGQPFDVTVTIGWDASLSARLNHAELSMPWWDKLPGAIEIESTQANLGGRRVNLGLQGGGQIISDALGRRTIDGRDLVVYEIRRSYLATSAGALRFPVSHLEFGRTAGGGLFDRARVVEMYYKSTAAMEYKVGALPEKGRPFDFGGAVGQIAVDARADRREVNEGDSIKLRVTWTGDGNLEFFDLPDLTHAPAFEGFKLFGVTDEVKSRNTRISTFDLAPTHAGVTEIPPVELVVYDPEIERYLRLKTAPVPIRVHALEGRGGLEDLEPTEPVDDIRDLFAGELSGTAKGIAPGSNRGRPLVIGGGALGLLLVFGGLRSKLRAGLDPAAPLERRRRRAKSLLVRDLKRASGADGRHLAFCSFLAARTRLPDGAWIGMRFGIDGLVEEGLGQRVDGVLDALERRAWQADSGGPGVSDEDLRGLAGELIQGGL